MSIKGFNINGQIQKYDYDALDNKPNVSGLSDQAKEALLNLFQHTAYVDANGQTYYQALYNALYSSAPVLTSISAVYSQLGTVYTTDTLDSLKSDLTVTAHYDDDSSETVTNYTLTGNLTVGTSVITVNYGGETTTFNVSVTRAPGTYSVSNNLIGCSNSNSATTVAEDESYTGTITANTGYSLTGATVSITMGGESVTGYYSNGTISIPSVTGDVVITVSAVAVTVSSISAVFSQGSAVIYDTDSLDTLKQYLVVTATYSDTTTATVSDYTLSGTLTVGTSTITVSYGGQTTTFNVTVSHNDNSIYNWDFTQGVVDSKQGATATLGSDVVQDSNGLTFTSGVGSYVVLADMSAYASSSFTVEMDCTTIVPVTANTNNTIINLTTSSSTAYGYGLNYRASQWKYFHAGTNFAPDDEAVSDTTIFNGKTLKLQINYKSKKVYLYADNVLLATYTIGYAGSNNRNRLLIGQSDASGSIRTGTVITGLRVYAGIV